MHAPTGASERQRVPSGAQSVGRSRPIKTPPQTHSASRGGAASRELGAQARPSPRDPRDAAPVAVAGLALDYAAIATGFASLV